jgi:hypothetical protein
MTKKISLLLAATLSAIAFAQTTAPAPPAAPAAPIPASAAAHGQIYPLPRQNAVGL